MAGKKAKSKSKAPTEINTEADFKKLCDTMDDQHQLFCDHYLITLNAADSYRKAGYKSTNKASVENSAIRLLSNVRVRNYIQWKIKQRKKKLAVDEKYVLDKLQQITKVKITDYFDIEDGSIYLKDLTKIPDAAVELIEEISETVSGIRIKLISKSSALDKIGAHMGMWNKDKQQGSGTGGTKFIIRYYVAPAIGNVVIRPSITNADIKEEITNYIKSRK